MKIFLPQLLFFCLFWLVFKGLQIDDIYRISLGQISVNQENTGNGIVVVKKPYKMINDKNMVYFDAGSYNEIRVHSYTPADDNLYGFYPLYPALWRLSQVPPRFAPILNFFFYVCGLLLIGRCFPSITQSKYEWLLLAFPGFISFIVPYSESLFFLCVAIALYGFTKSNYRLTFLGLFLASLTRAVSLIFFFALIAAEFVWWLSDRNTSVRIKSLAKHILPVLCATIIVSIIQYIYGSNSFFSFIDAHKNWHQTFSIPSPLTEWSFEGFGMNIASFFMVGAPAIAFSFASLFRKQFSRENFFQLLSAVFLAGSTLFVYFYQNGNLHSLFRYLISSPFFYILLYSIDIKSISISKRVFLFSVLMFNAIFMFTLSNYSVGINFTDLGFALVMLAIGLWVFNDFFHTIVYKSILTLVILSNVVWSTYLLNCFISNTWLFL